MANKTNNNLRKELFGLYKDCPLSTKLYIRQRWMPFRLCEDIESYIPLSGKILDLGCGYGLFSNYLALKSKDRKILGVDCIKERIRIAERVSSRKFNSRLEFKLSNILDFDIGLEKYECITLVDVLCYIPFEERLLLLKRCYYGLTEKGTLLIKDFHRRPILKFWLFYLSDYLVNMFRILFLNSDWEKAFKGKLFVEDFRKLSISLEKIGYTVKTIPFDKGSYESAIIYLCYKNGT